MANYTMELRQVLDIPVDIFDFNYTRTPASKAIISDADLEAGFKNHFYFREIAHETITKFKFRLKTQWLESIEIFDNLLTAYAQPINVKANLVAQNENTSVYNDTPKSALDFGDEATHATSITHNTQNNTSLAGLTEIEALELYHEKIKDIVTDFYKSFDNLFMQIF